MNAHGSVRALETWYSSCVYSAATRAMCFARFPRVLLYCQTGGALHS